MTETVKDDDKDRITVEKVEDAFREADAEAVALRAHIQGRFLAELGALHPPQFSVKAP